MFDWRPLEERGRSQADTAGRAAQLQPLGSMTLAAQKLNQLDAVHVRSLTASVAPQAVPTRPRSKTTRLHRLHSSMYPRVSYSSVHSACIPLLLYQQIYTRLVAQPACALAEAQWHRPQSLERAAPVAQGPGNNDRCAREHVINVVTALPFIMVGRSMYRYEYP